MPKAKKQPVKPKEKPEVNEEKLRQLRESSKNVRIGGAGSVRRKHIAVRKGTNAEDQKVMQNLKKLNLQPASDVEFVNFMMDDNSVLQFNKPKVQVSAPNNCFVVKGKPEKKSMEEILPDLLGSIAGMKDVEQLKKLAEQLKKEEGTTKTEEKKEEEVPQVDSFEAAS